MGHQLPGKFLTLFQAAAAEVLLSDSAKLAVLKVALDLTGSNLPPWSEPALSLSDLIGATLNFTSSSNNLHNNSNTQNLLSPAPVMILPQTISKDVVSLQNSPTKTPTHFVSSSSSSKTSSPTELEKSTTRYDLKQIHDSTATIAPTNVLCILDTDIAQSHACETSPIDGDDTSHYALLQNLSSPICQSLMTIGGHGETINYYSDDSLFDYISRPGSPSTAVVCVNRDNPTLPGRFLLSNILGALNLSPTSHTGAKVNFISIGLAERLGLDLIPGGLVKGGNSATFRSLDLSKPLVFSVGNHTFTERFCAAKNLVYHVILGIGWWRKYNVASHLKSISLLLTSPAGVSVTVHMFGGLQAGLMLAKQNFGCLLQVEA
ncbi:hypothetical protein DSO57_1008623 [Entomophthora muscae]|uniref:Uncharacterized protein n=1 Tax=Entomophthora muscae TaxID=34485 RepID=A0ACC2TTZ6_9FUNG|nr:hypothetical protein DSO57_1008623 [Entomophthora muscae]